MPTKSKNVKYTGIPSENGTFSTFYTLKNRKTIAFKDFENKRTAWDAYLMQQEMAKNDLAPKVYGDLRKIDYIDSCGVKRRSSWGYITEIAETINDEEYHENEYYHDDLRDEIEQLNDDIESYLGISFHDCHFGNVGYVIRNKQKVLVCIDTGEESFSGRYAY